MESRERNDIRRPLNELKPWLEAYVTQALGAPPVQRMSSSSTGHRRDADIQKLIAAVLESWSTVFARRLPPIMRTYLHELRDIRDRWAHEEQFSPEDVQRARSTIDLIARGLGVENVPTALAPMKAPSAPQSAPHGLRRERPRTQRAVMRELFARYGGDADRVIREYAAAERRGEAPRMRNASRLSPEEYARALFADGEKKGWLEQSD